MSDASETMDVGFLQAMKSKKQNKSIKKEDSGVGGIAGSASPTAFNINSKPKKHPIDPTIKEANPVPSVGALSLNDVKTHLKSSGLSGAEVNDVLKVIVALLGKVENDVIFTKEQMNAILNVINKG